jgi:hypothetical protein
MCGTIDPGHTYNEYLVFLAKSSMTPNPSVGECRKSDLDMGVMADARSLAMAVAAMWEVHWLWDILPTASRVPGYSEKPVTQKRSSHV